jgi:raffinose/stachyose/melibiose transport system permease protein
MANFKQISHRVIAPYCYLLPSLLLLSVFLFLPLIMNIRYSFYDFKLLIPAKFIGFANYISLYHDEDFWASIITTLKWVGMSAVLPGAVGLILALLIEYCVKGRFFSGVARTIFFMPVMMSLVSVGLLWSLIYDPMLGLLNALLRLVGLSSNANPVVFLGDPKTAIYVAFIPVIWQSAGFAMIIFSAALQSIPKDILESSVIDGATKFNQVRYIVLPYIFPTITLIFMVNMISGFKAFDLLRVLTMGGPSGSTEITSLLLYRTGFFAFKFAYASAMSLALFLVVIICVFFLGKVTDKLDKHFDK